MATRNKFNQTVKERIMRHFSKEFKQKKVREIEQKKTRISDVCREYEVSDTTVYRWLRQYSSQYHKGVRTIVESESDTRLIMELKHKIAELERVIGQKQVMIDFKDKIIDLAEQEYKIDIKKKLEKKPFSTSGSIENNSQKA
jgi:transposase-like protein